MTEEDLPRVDIAAPEMLAEITGKPPAIFEAGEVEQPHPDELEVIDFTDE